MKIKIDKLRLMCNEIFDQLENKYEDINITDRTFWYIKAQNSTKLYKPEAIVFDLDETVLELNNSIIKHNNKSKVEIEKLANLLKATAHAIEKYEE